MDTIASLKDTVKGAVVLPGDDTWDQERLAWHLAADQQPAAVVHVTGVDDIVAAVTFAKQHGLSVTAQARGHGATDALRGAILLRTLGLTAIEVDEQERIARVEPGVRWGELNEVLDETGLTGLPGSSGDTSVVGYTLGGGLSWFGRKYGQAANHVHAIELVTADAEHVRVTAESDPDLFWAVRGGGGDFGIVTALELDLFAEEHLYGGRMTFPAEHAREVFRAFVTATKNAPEELTLWAWLMNMPDAPMVPEPVRGTWLVMVDAVYLGPAERANELLAPIRAAAPLLEDTVGTVPLNQLDGVADEPVDPVPGIMHGTLLSGFDESAVDALVAAANPGHPSPLAAFEVRHLGGAFARANASDGAAGSVAEPYLLFFGGFLPAPELAPAIVAAMGEVSEAMAVWDTGRTLMNMSAQKPIEKLLPAETIARLRQIKQRRDPAGVIRSNHPVG
jgi:FAD/FMN-containing dehydrogenase